MILVAYTRRSGYSPSRGCSALLFRGIVLIFTSIKRVYGHHHLRHGSAKRYAEGLAERTGLKAVDYKEADSLGLYNRIIYFGAIYAGGVTGLKKTVAKLTHGQELYVITVGMVDPEDQAFIGPLREALKKQIPPQMYDENRIFHLRGAIDYSQLELKYRILMKMMYSQAAKLPEEKLTSEFKAVLATYGKKVDYVDLEMLQPLTAALKQS